MTSFIEANSKFINHFNSSLSQIKDLELAKQRLTYSRWKTCENLDKLLFEFETNLKKTDSKVFWCPDEKTSVEFFNAQLKNYNQVQFFHHVGIQHIIAETDIQVPEACETPEVVVMDAKFLFANTGNIYSAFYSTEEYNQFLNAKKVIVCAGIDTMLSFQSELQNAKLLYSVFETGHLNYPSEIIMRSGKPRGLKAEIVLMIYDLNKSQLLEHANYRKLFYLLNFKLPAVCPMQQLDYEPNNWKKIDTLQYFLYPLMHQIQSHQELLFNNNGLSILNEFIPYDLDLNQLNLDLRAELTTNKKTNAFHSLFSGNIAELPLNIQKFNDPNKFEKYAKAMFFGE